MGNIWATNTMLGIPYDETLLQQDTQSTYLQQATATSEAIRQLFPQVKTVANTFRFDRGAGIEYYSTLYSNELFSSAVYTADTVTDKVGSGDCFMAGLIFGLNNGHSPQQTLDFATAAAYNKLFIKGDTTNQSVEQIKATIKNV
jgi:2-dehydro-3-deoxygluconokinase